MIMGQNVAQSLGILCAVLQCTSHLGVLSQLCLLNVLTSPCRTAKVGCASEVSQRARWSHW